MKGADTKMNDADAVRVSIICRQADASMHLGQQPRMEPIAHYSL